MIIAIIQSLGTVCVESDLLNMTWRTDAMISASSNSTLRRISSGPAALLGLGFWSSFLIPLKVMQMFCIDR